VEIESTSVEVCRKEPYNFRLSNLRIIELPPRHKANDDDIVYAICTPGVSQVYTSKKLRKGVALCCALCGAWRAGFSLLL